MKKRKRFEHHGPRKNSKIMQMNKFITEATVARKLQDDANES